MEKKEKEARRKRWEQVVELAEKREEEIRNGSKGRVDGRWVEDKEEAGERTREAVLAAMKSGGYSDVMNISHGSAIDEEGSSSGSSPGDEDDKPESSTVKGDRQSTASRSFFGFDEDEDVSSEEEEETKDRVVEQCG
ncbi:MAG: hypothetical protein L6R39_002137 [Caloplaca ligustica]|nr:MAG: hypothetical protein L6R39_002137 [Caloplaca ligustica]